MGGINVDGDIWKFAESSNSQGDAALVDWGCLGALGIALVSNNCEEGSRAINFPIELSTGGCDVLLPSESGSRTMITGISGTR